MNVYMVTGASRGLGEAIVRHLLKDGNVVIAVSRSMNHELIDEANSKGVPFYYVKADLAKEENIEPLVNQMLAYINIEKTRSITLIQNAGVIEPIKPVGKTESEHIVKNVHVNLLAPMLLSNLFVQNLHSFSGRKVIVHVTSGAANRAVHGWSAYCSTKAGLNMFTKTLAFEQGKAKNPVSVIGFSPGIMDTDMQKEIRSKTKEDFEDIETFKNYYEFGKLRSPQLVAKALIELLHTEVKSGSIYHINDLLE